MNSLYINIDNDEGLGNWGSAISAAGNIGGGLISGIFGNKIAKINSNSLSFQEQTKRELSKDNLTIANINADTIRLQQQADLKKNEILAFNNQLNLKLQQEKDKEKAENTKYAIIAGVVSIVVIGGVIALTRKKAVKNGN